MEKSELPRVFADRQQAASPRRARKVREAALPSSIEELRAQLALDPVLFLNALYEGANLHRKSPLSEVELDIFCFSRAWDFDPITNTAAVNPTLPKTRGVLAPRWSGKTHIVTAGGCLWSLLRDHNRRVLIVSAGEDSAKATLHIVRQWIELIPFLQHLAPATSSRDNEFSFDIGVAAPGRNASVTAIGIDGQLEGNHVHEIFADDIETDANAETLKLRQRTRHRVTEFRSVVYGEMPGQEDLEAPIDRPGVVYVGTFHDEDSLYVDLSRKGYLFRTWPITIEPGDTHINLAPLFAHRLAQGVVRHFQPLWPHRFSAEAIAEKKSEGPRYFRLQHKLTVNANAADAHPLKLRDLVVTHVHRDIAPIRVAYGTHNHNGSTALNIPVDGLGDDALHGPAFIDPQTAPYTHTVAAIDPAGLGRDKTGLAIVAHLGGLFFVKCVRGLPGGLARANMDTLAQLLFEHDASEVVYEKNFDGQGAFRQFLEAALERRRLAPNTDPARPGGWACSVVPVHSSGQKEHRILSALEPAIGDHRLIVHQPEIELSPPFQEPDPANELQRQLTRITRERNSLPEDGKIDALAMAVAHLKSCIAIDPDKAHQELATVSIEERMADAFRTLDDLTETRQPAWCHDPSPPRRRPPGKSR